MLSLYITPDTLENRTNYIYQVIKSLSPSLIIELYNILHQYFIELTSNMNNITCNTGYIISADDVEEYKLYNEVLYRLLSLLLNDNNVQEYINSIPNYKSYVNEESQNILKTLYQLIDKYQMYLYIYTNYITSLIIFRVISYCDAISNKTKCLVLSRYIDRLPKDKINIVDLINLTDVLRLSTTELYVKLSQINIMYICLYTFYMFIYL